VEEADLFECEKYLQKKQVFEFIDAFEQTAYLTPFEKKYHQSGQQLWKLQANLG